MGDYKADDDPEGPVLLMVVPEEVPEELLPRPGDAVPAIVALVDVLDSADARQRHLAASLIAKAVVGARAALERT